MIGVFIDTFIVLTLNALVVISTLYTADGPLAECGAAAASTVLTKTNLAQVAFGTVLGENFGAMFVAGARLTVPLLAVVLRKGYGLGAMAMAGGSLHAPLLTVSWPTGEFGGMGLEGAVRLGYRKELDALTDPAERRARYDELVAQYYARGKAVSMASAFEIDDVIDPADTRAVLVRALART